MRNQYPGICYRCGLHVEPGEGHFERITAKHRQPGNHDKWRTQHADCAIRWRGIMPPPTREEALAAREQIKKATP